MVACGGDDDDATPTAPAGSTSTASAAAALVPKLDDLGFQSSVPQKDPGNPTIDSAMVLYRTAGAKQAQVRIYVLPTAGAAKTQYDAFAVQLKNPPVQFLGIDAKWTGTPSPQLGEQRTSYKTETPDSQGTFAYTDLYLKGTTVVLTQVLDNAPDSLPLRTTIGERALANAK